MNQRDETALVAICKRLVEGSTHATAVVRHEGREFPAPLALVRPIDLEGLMEFLERIGA